MYSFNAELVDFCINQVNRLVKRMNMYQIYRRLKPYYPDLTIGKTRKLFIKLLAQQPVQLLPMLTENTITKEDYVDFVKKTRIVIITGNMGTGKTDFSLLTYEWLKEQDHNLNLVTNITTPVSTRLTEENFNSENSVVVIDEAIQSLNLYTPVLKRLVKELFKEANFLRKRNSYFIIITIDVSLLVKPLRRIAKLIVSKLNKTTATVTESDLIIPRILFNIPPTKIKFDTYEITSFGDEE